MVAALHEEVAANIAVKATRSNNNDNCNNITIVDTPASKYSCALPLGNASRWLVPKLQRQ